MKSYAVYFVTVGQAELREIDVKDPRPDEVQVQCVANGICMAEVSKFKGLDPEWYSFPLIVGHEGIGIVTKVGREVENLAEGDCVVCRPWIADHNYRAAPLIKYTAPPDDPALFIAEPPSCVVGALYAYDITPGDRVLLLGAGYMGLLNVQGLARYPLQELVVTDLKLENLELAQSFGATSVLQSSTPEAKAELEAFKKRRFDLVVEAAGAAETLEMAGPLTRVGGRLAIFAWHHTPRAIDMTTWHLGGLTVLNAAPMISTDRSISIVERAVRLLENGTFDQSKLITHRHSVTEVQQAMELAVERPPEYIKGVLLFDA